MNTGSKRLKRRDQHPCDNIVSIVNRHETPMNCKLHQFLITKARKQGIAMKSKMLDANVSASVLQLKAPKEVARVRNKSKQNNKIPGTCKSEHWEDDGFLKD